MRQQWQRWVDCADAAGCPRQVELTVSEAGELVVTLPGGEAVSLQLYQAEQLRVGVVAGMESSGRDAARTARSW